MRHGNVISYIRRCLKLDCFTSTKWPADFARLINNCIIIYNNNYGMTVKTTYIPIYYQISSDIILMQHFSSNLLNQQQHIRSSMETMRSNWLFRNWQSAIKLTEYNQLDPKESHSF